jgi:hypothetical protein
MNRIRTFPFSYVHRAAYITALLIALALDAAPQQEGSASPPTNDHILFVGTDLSVKEGEKFLRVVGATRKTLKIEKDHVTTEVRLSKDPVVRISKGVKLSNRTATIGKVQTESIDRASARAQLAAMQAAMALSDDSGDSGDRLHGEMMRLDAVGINSNARADDGSLIRGIEIAVANVEAQRVGARASYVDTLPSLDRLTNATTTLLNQNLMQPNADDEEVTLDASALPGLNLIGGAPLEESGSSGGSSVDVSKGNVATGTAEVELTFELSSSEPMDNAYILVVANYASLTKPNEVARQISAQELSRIDSKPRRVKMTHAAAMNRLPFKKFDIALFSNGQEIATNLSEKRLALTGDQAYQFFLIEYLTSHKGATVPPTPILMTPRAEFRRQLEKTETSQTFHASVDKTGKVIALSSDTAGKEPVSASVKTALRNVRFMPALKQGVPVDGHLRMSVADLIR